MKNFLYSMGILIMSFMIITGSDCNPAPPKIEVLTTSEPEAWTIGNYDYRSHDYTYSISWTKGSCSGGDAVYDVYVGKNKDEVAAGSGTIQSIYNSGYDNSGKDLFVYKNLDYYGVLHLDKATTYYWAVLTRVQNSNPTVYKMSTSVLSFTTIAF